MRFQCSYEFFLSSLGIHDLLLSESIISCIFSIVFSSSLFLNSSASILASIFPLFFLDSFMLVSSNFNLLSFEL